MEKVRILIADDHPVFRDGIIRLLNEEADMEVVGQASNGNEAVSQAAKLKPDVIVMDITMPELNGIEAAKKIKADRPTTAILMLSAFDYDSYILTALRAGVAGFLSKGARSSELISAIRGVAVGEPVLDQAVAYRILNRMVASGETGPGAKLTELHDRELEVLRFAAKGMTNKAIAHELFISERTVQTHFLNIFRKLNVGSRTEAVLRALKQGWITLDDLP